MNPGNARTSIVEVIVNYLIAVAVGVIPAIIADTYLGDLLGKTAVHWLGVVAVGLAITKSFLSTTWASLKNQQSADAPDAPPTGRADDPVNVTETPPAVTGATDPVSSASTVAGASTLPPDSDTERTPVP